MTRFIYMDESGELGTRVGSSRHFLIAAISLPDPIPLERKIKRLNAQLYTDGWPRDVEIKGTTLWSCQAKIQLRERVPVTIRIRRTDIIREYLAAIHAAGCRIAYSVALKEKMTDRLLQTDYGIVYNWLSGLLLTRYYEHALRGHDVTLCVDQRNKERHHHRHFDGYIQGRFFELYPDCRQLIIRHETGIVRGLQAVDFVSWSLFRYFEHNDRQFRDIVDRGNVFRDNWYARW